MKNPFKSGDYVICIDAERSDDYLAYGTRYLVEEALIEPDDDTLRVHLSGVKRGCGWYVERFELDEFYTNVANIDGTSV